jgi:hypothetical protein
VKLTDRITKRWIFPPIGVDAGQSIKGDFALTPGRRQWPRRMVMGCAKIFQYDSSCIVVAFFNSGEAAH